MSSTHDDTTTVATTVPWSEFFSTTAISIPTSLSTATTRIHQNLTRFKINYAHLSLTIFFISLIFHPFPLLILLLIALAWHYLFFSHRRDDPIEFYGITFNDQLIGGVLTVVTIVGLVYASVWMNLFVSVCVSGFVVLVHAVLRGDSLGDDGPYGGLLDDDESGYSAL